MIRDRRKRRTDGSPLDSLFRTTAKSLFSGVTDRLEDSVRDLAQNAMRRAVSVTLGITILAAASLFLLVAGIEGLKASHVPPWLAYLGIALVGALVALLLLRRRKSPSKE